MDDLEGEFGADLEAERGAFVFAALDADAALGAESHGNFLRDCEAEAVALHLVEAGAKLEELLLLVEGESFAGVGDFEPDGESVGAGGDFESDLASAIGELDGVGDEVDENLFDPDEVGVDLEVADLLRDGGFELDFFELGLLGEEVAEVVEDFDEFEDFGLDADFLGVHVVVGVHDIADLEIEHFEVFFCDEDTFSGFLFSLGHFEVLAALLEGDGDGGSEVVGDGCEDELFFHEFGFFVLDLVIEFLDSEAELAGDF